MIQTYCPNNLLLVDHKWLIWHQVINVSIICCHVLLTCRMNNQSLVSRVWLIWFWSIDVLILSYDDKGKISIMLFVTWCKIITCQSYVVDVASGNWCANHVMLMCHLNDPSPIGHVWSIWFWLYWYYHMMIW